jgi:hypothetical protein
MAKFSRFDPRNKKQNRNKMRSLDRDIRIHEEKKSQRTRFNKWDVPNNEPDDEYEDYETWS